MNVKQVDIKVLKPYENNPRYNDEAVKYVAKSIEEFGFKVPIVIDANNVIVTGHTRYKAALELELKTVPCIIADDLNEEQVQAFRIADNKVAEIAEWDIDKLLIEIETLSDDYEWLELSDIVGGLDVDTEEIEKEISEDFDEVTYTDIEYGDVFKLGEHILMCGDSTSQEDVNKLMGSEKLDLWLTDPPYNVAYEGGTSDSLTIMNDNMDDESFLLFLTDAFVVASKVLKKGGAFYIWHADSESYNFRKALRNTQVLMLKQNLIWVKNSLVLGRQDYQWKHEPCLYGWKEGAAHYFIEDRKQTTVFDERPNLELLSNDELIEYIEKLEGTLGLSTVIYEDKPNANREHPTMKPIKLLARTILNSTKETEIVGDFFGGSGSTLLACETLNRRCRTMELDPKYCQVIINRWEELTGKNAVKVVK